MALSRSACDLMSSIEGTAGIGQLEMGQSEMEQSERLFGVSSKPAGAGETRFWTEWENPSSGTRFL